jgi:glyoxylase-like metal-dependent hydrolase (beta-lactamase superfamily II)
VDCGAFDEVERCAISDYIKENGLKPVLLVLTHGHFDHVMGCKWVFDNYGLQPVINDGDAELYKAFRNDAQSMGFIIDYDLPAIGRCVNDGDIVKFGNTEFKVIHTPGHSKGCVVYYNEKEGIAFTGDTLFRGSIGRTDLPGGSMFQIIQSLRMLTQLPDATKVFTGHGPSTTIGQELATNPYLDR